VREKDDKNKQNGGGRGRVTESEIKKIKRMEEGEGE
jgi:hypothetical protein